MSEKIVIKKNEGNMLAVIDMQRDFAEETGALYVRGIKGEPRMDTITTRILNFLELPFDYWIATRDVHPKEHVEAHIFGEHCRENSEGSMLIPEIYQRASVSNVIDKGTSKYVIGYSVATSKDFDRHIEFMRMNKIKRVFVCGLAYTHCVGESAIAYAAQGFETYVIRDATRSVPPPYGNPEVMDKKLALYNVKLINYADIA